MIAVDHAVRAGVITDLPGDLPVLVNLRYAKDDPFAVHVVFATQAAQGTADAHWVFARDLLAEGIRSGDGAGLGSVCVVPLSPGRTAVELRSSQGVAVIRFATRDLDLFLAATYRLVPPGTEQAGECLERFLAHVLTQR